MRFVYILILTVLTYLPSVQAKYRSTHRAGGSALMYAPAREMLQSLDSMSELLHSVSSRQTADLAAPRLTELYNRYTKQRNAAENMPSMSEKAMTQHLTRMDEGMNTFRLACARLIQVKFYGSEKLGHTVQKIAHEF